MRYRGYIIMRRASGHFDIYDSQDNFLHRADSQSEAEREIDSYHTDTTRGGLVR